MVTVIADSVHGIPVREFQIIADPEAVAADGEPIDLLVSSRSGDKQNDQRLFGTFSAAGRNYETSGDIVQDKMMIRQHLLDMNESKLTLVKKINKKD
uniref:Phage protein n=1 Tax=Elaeophora elaphi TaxID=1147741 RepID=A0A0R3RNQ3_9BILA